MKSLAIICLTALTFLVAGCNTVQGFGRDVEEAGDAVEDATDGEE